MKDIKKRGLLLTYLATITSIILWGFSFVWTKEILDREIPIFTFLFVRLFLAGILLFVFSWVTKNLQKVTLKDFGYMFLMAFFEPFIYFIGETYGMQITGSAVITAVIIATIPITCMFVEKFLYNIPFTVYKIIGTIVTIPGILLVMIGRGVNDPDSVISGLLISFNVDNIFGIGLLFVAVAGATGYAAVVKKLSGRYNAPTIATYQFLIGAALFLPFFLLLGIDGLNETFFTWDVLMPILSLAILCSCVAFIFWVYSIKYLGMTKANIFSALIPAVSAIGAAMLGQETTNVIMIIGIIIVIAGVILAQKSKIK